MKKKLYHYFLPQKNLALTPATPRDSSRLFVYETLTDKIIFDHFYHLNKYLPKHSFLVLNETSVLPARVVMRKSTGGKVVVLFLVNELTSAHVIKAIVDRKLNLGNLVYFDNKNFLEVVDQKENIFYFKYDFSREKLFTLIKKYGTMPIPLYLRKTPLKKEQLLKKYQTIFAQPAIGTKLASVAAPTASLHFTERVFRRLEKKGIKKYFITLHVGLGTFAPITEKNLKVKKLHKEYFEVEKKVWQDILKEKSKGKKLVAVGTTVVRALESAFENFITRESHPPNRRVPSKVKNFLPPPFFFGETDLFIFPPYNFKMVDHLITNFHLPGSSLMMLVEAFLQHKGAKKHLVELYNIAIKNNFRFYSFGDAMIIL
ncbi:MAG: tRNA preQ1(34) S-adenosylmethionine ribosyltransferase-isomerase QueA [Microgenomates group bacterium]